MEFDVLWAALHGVSAYAELLKTPVMEQSRALVGSLAQGRGTEALEAYTQLFHLLRREGYQGLGDWLWDGLRYVESPYGTLAERGDSDPALENAARPGRWRPSSFWPGWTATRYVGEPVQSAAPGVRSGAGWAAPVAGVCPF